MVQIAIRAEVAPATLYNLFRTKGAILREVFDRDLAEFREAVAREPAENAIERLFAALALAATLYDRNPQFYRAMARVEDHGSERLKSAISGPRSAFWGGLLQQAHEDGSLQPRANPEVLGAALSHLMTGAFLAWASNAITAERLAQEAGYGFALLLTPKVNRQVAVTLIDRIEVLERTLAAPPPRAIRRD